MITISWRLSDTSFRQVIQEKDDIIEKRIEAAKKEMLVCKNYTYVIVNEDVDECADKLYHIINAEHLKVKDNKNIIEEVCKL